MISPDVEVLGVEPEGYAWLCDRVAARQSLQGDWLWGRHDGERLLALVPESPTGDDRVGGIDLSEPATAAASLRSSLGLARVVLIDDRRRFELGQSLDQAAAPGITQWEFFRACQRRFWSSPAVATSPEPPSDSWDLLADALRDASDLDVVLLVTDAGSLFLGLRATIRSGLMVRLSGALPEQDDPPSDLAGVLAEIDAKQRVDVVLAGTRTAFEAVLASPDLIPALRKMATSPEVVHVRGLEKLGKLFAGGEPQ